MIKKMTTAGNNTAEIGRNVTKNMRSPEQAPGLYKRQKLLHTQQLDARLKKL